MSIDLEALTAFEPEYTAMVDASAAYKTSANVSTTSKATRVARKGLCDAIDALSVASGQTLPNI